MAVGAFFQQPAGLSDTVFIHIVEGGIQHNHTATIGEKMVQHRRTVLP